MRMHIKTELQLKAKAQNFSLKQNDGSQGPMSGGDGRYWSKGTNFQ